MAMKSAEKLTAAQKLVSQCDRCGTCLTVCPLFGSKDIESSAARGKNAILRALRRAGIDKEEQTVHGYRHTASVRLNEMSVWNPDAIEAALTHKMPGVRGVYAGRAQYLDERRRMMQAWADYLDELRTGSNVIPIRGVR